ncbi:MAG: radical SAM protein [Candidatus Methylarchaceae archaeon HK02M1]|nr:radical SAM protein [Candidatus Methylarchaceae archaeon HK02M1]
MIKYSYITCKEALSHSRLLGLDYSLNPYFGCEHGCIYCYSPSVFRNEKIARNWGNFVKAKINIVDVLSKQLKKIPKGVVGISTVTDPYQPLEAKLQLTRKCIEVLSANNFPISIQTKSDLVLRDKDLIKPERFDIGVTIITLDNDLSKKLGSKTYSPESLIQVLEEFSDKGVDTWIFLGPIIPEINDDEENISQLVDIAKRTKSEIIYDKLNLKPWILDSMEKFLENERFGLKDRLPFLITKNSEYWRTFRARIEALCLREGVQCKPAFP